MSGPRHRVCCCTSASCCRLPSSSATCGVTRTARQQWEQHARAAAVSMQTWLCVAWRLPAGHLQKSSELRHLLSNGRPCGWILCLAGGASGCSMRILPPCWACWATRGRSAAAQARW